MQRLRRRREAPQDEQPTIPAGVDPAQAAAPPAPSFRDRGRYRRRLRYLRRVRELGFRDLGGLVFDLNRFGRQGDELVRAKVTALVTVDRELRAIERVLGDRREVTELHEPGIASCPRCGALHGSDARFCPACGVPFRGPRALAEIGEGGVQAVGEIGAVTPHAQPATAAQPSAGAQPVTAEQPTVAMDEGRAPEQPAEQVAPHGDAGDR